VLTGSEMVVWGGADARGAVADGAAYDPEADSWREIAGGPVASRTGHTAVWTGEEVLVWGGCCDVEGGELADGGAYAPDQDRWTSLPQAPLSARQAHSATWTGTEMVVWGGRTGLDRYPEEGAAYDPVERSWDPLPEAPIGPRAGHTAVWTGETAVVWGGCCAAGQRSLGDGAQFRLAIPGSVAPSPEVTDSTTTSSPQAVADDPDRGAATPVLLVGLLVLVGLGLLGLLIRRRAKRPR
jgi:N-acetylneuraminic acid mutarotase